MMVVFVQGLNKQFYASQDGTSDSFYTHYVDSFVESPECTALHLFYDWAAIMLGSS